MQVQKQQNNIIASPSINRLINDNIGLLQYFRSHCQEKDYAQLAVQLITQAISSRKHQPIKRYNVAYIKHNRFLSPSQKQHVTPKVTEVIPVSPDRVVIFGKPKVKLMAGEFCVQHGKNQLQNSQKDSNMQNYSRSSQNISKNQIPLRSDSYLNQNARKQNKYQIRQDSESYLNPKDNRTPQEYARPQKIKKNKKDSLTKKQYSKSTKYQLNGRQLQQKANIKAVQSNQQATKSPPSKKPPQHGRYHNVQSKHKLQIERDKRNKKLQKQLQQQKRKLERLEERQQRLLLKQYQQGKQIQRQSMPYTNGSICCSCSSEDEFDHRYISLGERVHDMHMNLKINGLKDKTYKISAQPIYPLTGSSSSGVDLQMQGESSDY